MSWLLAGKLPSKMTIEPEAGSKVEGVSGGCATTLAPYLFPMLTIPFFVIRLVLGLLIHFTGLDIPRIALMGVDFLIGVTWGMNAVLVLKHFDYRQTDLKKVGWVFSTVMIFFLNFVYVVAILVVVTDSYAELGDFVMACVATTKEFYVTAWHFLRDKLVPWLKELGQRIGLLLCKECPDPGATPTRPVGK
jgi:hypothetical protein